MAHQFIDLSVWQRRLEARPGDPLTAEQAARAYLVHARQLTRLGLDATPEGARLLARYSTLTSLLRDTRRGGD